MAESPHKNALPAGTHAFGMGLFLATLTMLFMAGLLVYWIVRLRTSHEPGGLPLQSIEMPWQLFVSTPCMLLASGCIHRAFGKIARGQTRAFKQALVAGAVLSVVFITLQVPALWELAREHWQARAHLGAVNNDAALDLSVKLKDADPLKGQHAFYGSILFLIAIHAAHVLGGVIPLGVVVANAFKGCYTQASHTPVRMLVWYWHFLDIVWVVLFATFLILG